MYIPNIFMKISVYGRPSEINSGLGNFALEVAEKTLTYLNAQLGVPGAIPPKIGKNRRCSNCYLLTLIYKSLCIDLIAIPFYPDFSTPSWGLNGFREDDLFYNVSINSKADKQFTALSIAKEMAHMVAR